MQGQEHKAPAQPLLPVGSAAQSRFLRCWGIYTAGSSVKLAIMDFSEIKRLFAVSVPKGSEARDEAKVRFTSKPAMPQDISAAVQTKPDSQLVLQNEALAWMQRTSAGAHGAPRAGCRVHQDSHRAHSPSAPAAGSPAAKFHLFVPLGDPSRLLQLARGHPQQGVSWQNEIQPVVLLHPKKVLVPGCRHPWTCQAAPSGPLTPILCSNSGWFLGETNFRLMNEAQDKNHPKLGLFFHFWLR